LKAGRDRSVLVGSAARATYVKDSDDNSDGYRRDDSIADNFREQIHPSSPEARLCYGAVVAFAAADCQS